MTGELNAGRDIVVIGASSGGVEALFEIAAGLPSGFPATVFIALHMGPGFASRLPELLSQRGRCARPTPCTARPPCPAGSTSRRPTIT
jgi:two-component system chemotaxis response regulator CheB